MINVYTRDDPRLVWGAHNNVKTIYVFENYIFLDNDFKNIKNVLKQI